MLAVLPCNQVVFSLVTSAYEAGTQERLENRIFRKLKRYLFRTDLCSREEKTYFLSPRSSQGHDWILLMNNRDCLGNSPLPRYCLAVKPHHTLPCLQHHSAHGLRAHALRHSDCLNHSTWTRSCLLSTLNALAHLAGRDAVPQLWQKLIRKHADLSSTPNLPLGTCGRQRTLENEGGGLGYIVMDTLLGQEHIALPHLHLVPAVIPIRVHCSLLRQILDCQNLLERRVDVEADHGQHLIAPDPFGGISVAFEVPISNSTPRSGSQVTTCRPSAYACDTMVEVAVLRVAVRTSIPDTEMDQRSNFASGVRSRLSASLRRASCCCMPLIFPSTSGNGLISTPRLRSSRIMKMSSLLPVATTRPCTTGKSSCFSDISFSAWMPAASFSSSPIASRFMREAKSRSLAMYVFSAFFDASVDSSTCTQSSNAYTTHMCIMYMNLV
eukprot:26439_5